MRFLLDTNICIFFLRGKLDLAKILKEKGRKNCFISEMTVFELHYGAANSRHILKSHKAVDNFIDGLPILPIYSCVQLYASEKVRLRKKGLPMNDEFDLLIAVTSVRNKLTLVTDNGSHFKNINNLQIENWFKHP